MLNELSWSRAMPIGLSCLLHVGLVTGLILGQSWVTSVVALQPPVLPVQLVTLDAVEPPRDPAPAAPPRRERATPIRRPEPPRPREVAAAKIEEPAPAPVAPAPTPAPAPSETAPAPAVVAATLPAISEPAPAPGPSAPAASGTTIALPASAPIVAAQGARHGAGGRHPDRAAAGRLPGAAPLPAARAVSGSGHHAAARARRLPTARRRRARGESAGHPDLDQRRDGGGAALALRAGAPRRRRGRPCGCCSPSNSGSSV